MILVMEKLSQCHFVCHKSHADWRANELVLIRMSNYVTHIISFAFTYVAFQHLFLYLPVLCQNVDSCKFLTNASV